MKYKLRECVAVDEIPDYLYRWEKKVPNKVKIEALGKASGYDVMSAVFTDRTMPDDDKQVALIIAQHSGMEISGMTTVLSLGNWLCSGDPIAEEILKKQIVVLVPCPNPYTYATQSVDHTFQNEFGVDEYISIDYDGVKEPEKTPAALLIKNLIDKYRPEMLIDSHGVAYQNSLVLESLGYSAFSSNRMYNNGFMENMQKAAEDAGFAVWREDAMQKNFPVSEFNRKNASKYRPGADKGIAPVYAYFHYHTMAASMEVSFEKSGFLRMKKALEMGNEKAAGEYYSGYPTRTIISPIGNHSLRAYGQTAEERRKSRVELWNNSEDFFCFVVGPEMIGQSTLVMVSDFEPIDRESADINNNYHMPLIHFFSQYKEIDIEAIKKSANYSDEAYKAYFHLPDKKARKPKYGVTMRIGIPFADARLEKVLLNGKEMEMSAEYGYIILKSENWTYVDYNIPHDKIEGIMIATVCYDCDAPERGIMEF